MGQPIPAPDRPIPEPGTEPPTPRCLRQNPRFRRRTRCRLPRRSRRIPILPRVRRSSERQIGPSGPYVEPGQR
jgi:hypothetical protein